VAKGIVEAWVEPIEEWANLRHKCHKVQNSVGWCTDREQQKLFSAHCGRCAAYKEQKPWWKRMMGFKVHGFMPFWGIVGGVGWQLIWWLWLVKLL